MMEIIGKGVVLLLLSLYCLAGIYTFTVYARSISELRKIASRSAGVRTVIITTVISLAVSIMMSCAIIIGMLIK